jgi:hypothetical protein
VHFIPEVSHLLAVHFPYANEAVPEIKAVSKPLSIWQQFLTTIDTSRIHVRRVSQSMDVVDQGHRIGSFGCIGSLVRERGEFQHIYIYTRPDICCLGPLGARCLLHCLSRFEALSAVQRE